jgi:hypothetical protein
MTEHIHISAAEFVVFLMYFIIATVLLRTLSAYVHSKGQNGPFSNALAYIG